MPLPVELKDFGVAGRSVFHAAAVNSELFVNVSSLFVTLNSLTEWTALGHWFHWMKTCEQLIDGSEVWIA
jgi:hypothetical protein